MATRKLGRSLLAGETTVAELRALTKGFTAAKHYLTDELTTFATDSVVVDGDLRLAALDTFEEGVCCLVVTGDLVVDGLYQDRDYPQTAVFVLGHFTASNAITAGALGVAGNLTVEDTLVGYYNDHAAEVKGTLTARTFVPENHHFSIGVALSCEHLLGRNAHYRIKVKGKKPAPVDELAMKALLVPEVLDVLGEGDQLEINLEDAVLRKRVRDGLPILQHPASAATTKRAAAKPTAKKTTTKTATKPTATKPAATKPAAKKTATNPAATKPAATKKPADKKPANKKPANKKPAANKPAATKKPANKKPAANKNPAAKNPAAKNPATATPTSTTKSTSAAKKM